MNHQVEQLAGLGLKASRFLVGLDFAHRVLQRWAENAIDADREVMWGERRVFQPRQCAAHTSRRSDVRPRHGRTLARYYRGTGGTLKPDEQAARPQSPHACHASVPWYQG